MKNDACTMYNVTSSSINGYAAEQTSVVLYYILHTLIHCLCGWIFYKEISLEIICLGNREPHSESSAGKSVIGHAWIQLLIFYNGCRP